MKLLIVQTVALLAGPPATSTTLAPNELNDARSAFGHCMQQQVIAASSTEAPDAIVEAAFAACRAQQDRLRLALAAAESGSAEQQASALRKFDEGMVASRVRLTDYIRSFRNGAATRSD